MSPAKKKRRGPGALRGEAAVPARKGRRISFAVVPGMAELDQDPEMSDIISEYLPRLKGNREQVRTKISMIALTTHVPGQKRMSAKQAYKSLFPDLKDSSCASQSCRIMAAIENDIGEDGRYALQGVHLRRVTRVLGDASGATFVRQFYDSKTGKVVEGRPLGDHALRLKSAELMMRLLGLGREPEPGSGPITVNVVSYIADPKTATPWPGGGRVVNGVLVQTCGSSAALPPARPDFVDRAPERED